MFKILTISFVSVVFSIQTANAWTLLLSSRVGFSSNEITINFSNTDCSANAGLSSNELIDMVEKSIDRYWNGVSGSALELKIGSVKDISVDGLTSATQVAALADVNTILIGCNDDVSSFSSGTLGIGGMSCTSTSCRGGLILNNATNAIATSSDLEVQTIIGHEIGHAFGLGHTSEEFALMFYTISGKEQEHLAQDDIDGVTYLYPQDKEIGGFGGTCGSIDINSGNGPGSGMLSFAMGLILILAISQRRRPKLKVLKY